MPEGAERGGQHLAQTGADDPAVVLAAVTAAETLHIDHEDRPVHRRLTL
ncbi:hypothetical protein [Kutzneria kofuensis]